MALADSFKDFAAAANKRRAKAADVIGEQGGKAVDAAVKKGQDVQRAVMLKRYNPVTESDLLGMAMPKLIVVDEEGDRKDIEVCQGAIGWMEKHAGVETFHVYDDCLDRMPFKLAPRAMLGCIYFFENFSGDRYLELGSFFDSVKMEKRAELLDLARSLGAKRCRLEVQEEKKHAITAQAKAKRGAKAGKVGKEEEAAEASLDSASERNSFIAFDQSFDTDGVAHQPDLLWYAEDPAVLQIVKARLDDEVDSKMTHYRMQLRQSTSSLMSVSMAGNLEAACKDMGAELNFSLEGQVKKSLRQEMYFEIDF